MDQLQPIVLKNKLGFTLKLSPYGAGILSLLVPDTQANLVDVIVGPASISQLTDPDSGLAAWCMGSSVGPFAGRISGGGFTLNDKPYVLNELGEVCLHSGPEGWQHQNWEVRSYNIGDQARVEFGLIIPRDNGKFPGGYEARVTYGLIDNELRIDYRVHAQSPIIINPTNHSYFNPGGSRPILGCELHIAASKYLETDAQLIPSGRFISLDKDELDFRQPRRFDGSAALDHCYVLDNSKTVARVYSPVTGISIEVETDRPGLVVFTPEKLNGLPLKDQMETVRFPAICFECQNFPDAPNQPAFPSAVLGEDKVFRSTTIYRFTVD